MAVHLVMIAGTRAAPIVAKEVGQHSRSLRRLRRHQLRQEQERLCDAALLRRAQSKNLGCTALSQPSAVSLSSRKGCDDFSREYLHVATEHLSSLPAGDRSAADHWGPTARPADSTDVGEHGEHARQLDGVLDGLPGPARRARRQQPRPRPKQTPLRNDQPRSRANELASEHDGRAGEREKDDGQLDGLLDRLTRPAQRARRRPTPSSSSSPGAPTSTTEASTKHGVHDQGNTTDAPENAKNTTTISTECSTDSLRLPGELVAAPAKLVVVVARRHVTPGRLICARSVKLSSGCRGPKYAFWGAAAVLCRKSAPRRALKNLTNQAQTYRKLAGNISELAQTDRPTARLICAKAGEGPDMFVPAWKYMGNIPFGGACSLAKTVNCRRARANFSVTCENRAQVYPALFMITRATGTLVSTVIIE